MNEKGFLLVFSTAVISGFSIFINKYAVAFSDPYIFTFSKNIVVALFLLGLLLATKDIAKLKKLDFKKWMILVSIGLVGGSIPFLLFFKGLTLTTAAQGSFLQKTMFVYVAILAAIFLKEKIDRRFLIGGTLLMLGNLVILKDMNFSLGMGNLVILAATLFWAIENIISKYALKDLSGGVVAWGRMFFGSFFILIFLGFNGQIREISAISIHQIGWIGMTSILLFGYVITWYGGLKLIPASSATSILVLGAPITTALSFFSGGKIVWQDISSMVLIFLGVALIIGTDFISESTKRYAKKMVRA